MVIKFKQKCSKCKTNYVLVTRRDRFPVCYECDKAQMQGKITDPDMKQMFDIPEEYYIENQFLRNIKINYLKFQSLTERQIEAFKKTVAKIKEEKSGEVKKDL